MNKLIVAALAVIVVPMTATGTVSALPPSASPMVASPSIDEQRDEVERVVNELDRLSVQAETLGEELSDAVYRRDELVGEIEQAKERVAEKEGEVAQLNEALSSVAVDAYTGAGGEVMGPLFSEASDFNEQLRQDEYRSVALDTGAVANDDLEQVVSELGDEKADLEDKLAEQERLTAQIETQQRETDELIAQYQERRQAEEARLGQLIREEEERRAAAALAAARAKAEAEAEAARQAAAAERERNSSSSGGGQSDGGQVVGDPGSGDDSSPGDSSPPVAGGAQAAVQAAMSQRGLPYRWGTSKPGVSFDCSGLTLYAWGKAGVYLPHKASSQQAMLPGVSPADARPGDLVFFGNPATHVGIYIGNQQMVHAPQTGDVVKVSSVSWNRVSKVGRPG